MVNELPSSSPNRSRLRAPGPRAHRAYPARDARIDDAPSGDRSAIDTFGPPQHQSLDTNVLERTRDAARRAVQAIDRILAAPARKSPTQR